MVVEICVHAQRLQAATSHQLPSVVWRMEPVISVEFVRQREREREDGILFSMGGGVQIIRSMKRKVTLSREWSSHSPRSFPVAAHPSQVPLPQLLSRGYEYSTSYVNTIQTDVLQRIDSSSL